MRDFPRYVVLIVSNLWFIFFFAFFLGGGGFMYDVVCNEDNLKENKN